MKNFEIVIKSYWGTDFTLFEEGKNKKDVKMKVHNDILFPFDFVSVKEIS